MTNKKTVLDGYENTYNKLGGLVDFLSRTTFQAGVKIGEVEASDLYEYNWLAQKIIDQVVNDSLRQWVSLKHDDSELVSAVSSQFKKLDLKNKLSEAFRLDRIYGGAAMIMLVKDGADDPREPLNISNIKEVLGFNVVDRYNLSGISRYINPLNPKFGKYEIYRINTEFATTGTGSIVGLEVHESRMIIFDGLFLPRRRRLENDDWGASVFDSMSDQLKLFGISNQTSGLLLKDFITKVLKTKALKEGLAAGKANAIQSRMADAAAQMGNEAITMIDAEEEFLKIQTPVTGFTDIQDRIARYSSTAAGIPHDILFGKQTGSLGTRDDISIRTYYDRISGEQESKLEKPINRIIEVILSLLKTDEKVLFEFNSLWQSTDKEKAEVKKIVADTDALNIQNQIYTPEEARQSHYDKDGNFSLEIILDPENDESNNDLNITEVDEA